MWAHEQVVHAACTPLLPQAPPPPQRERSIITAGVAAWSRALDPSHCGLVGLRGLRGKAWTSPLLVWGSGHSIIVGLRGLFHCCN